MTLMMMTLCNDSDDDDSAMMITLRNDSHDDDDSAQ